MASESKVERPLVVESTNVKGIVISAETVDNCLLRSRFISDDPVWFTVLGNGLPLGRTRDYFGEFVTVCFGTQIKRGILSGKVQKI